MDVLVTSKDGVGVQTDVNVVVTDASRTNIVPIRRVQCSISLVDSSLLGLQLGSTLTLYVSPTAGSYPAPRLVVHSTCSQEQALLVCYPFYLPVCT